MSWSTVWAPSVGPARLGDLALPAAGPRRLLAGARARRPASPVDARALAERGGRRAGPQRGRRDRPVDRQPAATGLSRRLPQSCWWTTAATTARPTGALAAAADGAGRLDVLRGAPLPAGWTGKLWAQHQGVTTPSRRTTAPDYLLLTDADIGHAPDNLRALVARAESQRLVLTSLMAQLSCRSWAERFLIPAFVFFFQMLYPFAWVHDRNRTVAAAAGGCMLVRREALERAGGIAVDPGRDHRRLRAGAPAEGPGADLARPDRRARSLRPYEGLGEIGRMVSRSAYAQLGYSPLLLAGTVAGMVLDLSGAAAAGAVRPRASRRRPGWRPGC